MQSNVQQNNCVGVCLDYNLDCSNDNWNDNNECSIGNNLTGCTCSDNELDDIFSPPVFIPTWNMCFYRQSGNTIPCEASTMGSLLRICACTKK